jgi:RimJ/RimL family protein N-acetyltransferase
MPDIGGGRVTLRPFERADAIFLKRWMNDPEILERLSHPVPMRARDVAIWAHYLATGQTQLGFGIVVEKNVLIGLIALYDINWHHRTARTGTIIGEKKYWRHGYATEAKELLLQYAFNSLDLQIIESHILSDDQAGLAYARKCGYEEAGRVPLSFRRHDGTRSDKVVLYLTQEKCKRSSAHTTLRA